MKMKKFFSIVLLGAMCMGFVSCENDEPEVNNNGNGSGGGTTNPTTQTYTVTLTVNDEAMGTVTGAGTYNDGDTAILTATANEGYIFVKWSDDETENPRTITVMEDLTLEAYFEAESGVDFNGHEYVDLGLPSGTLWATCNVGATSPEEYGNYYAWGEVEPKSYYNFYKDGEYKWGTYDGSDSQNYGMTKYNKTDGKTVLDPEDDAAHVNWGGDWRMPTGAEQDELCNSDNCTWTWTTDYNGTGTKGYIVSSNAEGNTNCIFLPAAGFRYYSSLYDAGSFGHYWSSSLSTSYPSHAYYLIFDSDGYDWGRYFRYYGQSVRAVCSAK